MASKIFDYLPDELILDISTRAHKLLMRDILPQLKNPMRYLLTLPNIDEQEWFFIQDYIRVVCLLSDGKTIEVSHTSFTQEIQKVIYVSPDCCVGRMVYGAWFIYLSNIFEDYVILVNDKDRFLKKLPVCVRADLGV